MEKVKATIIYPIYCNDNKSIWGYKMGYWKADKRAKSGKRLVTFEVRGEELVDESKKHR